ncbi:MAG: DUF1080 domain-containing protein [Planctomycetaceae bacterium]|jgi:hypothetical protein|nr:DUF1080 domain-containing protein [Planctomycetaceae bacterium]
MTHRIFLTVLFCLTAAVLFSEEKKEDEYAWKPLFDGKTLKDWTVPQYGGDGEVSVKDGCIVIGQGAMITGIKYEKLFPQLDYELRYEAQRTQGTDFFAAATFPYKDSYCTFINGGWGGSTVGLSCINEMDASENETGNFHSFNDNQWYTFRIIVTGAKIQVFVIGDTKKEKNKEENLIDLEVGDKKVSLRDETTQYKPLGICTWVSEGHIRNIKYRKLKPEEIDGKKK